MIRQAVVNHSRCKRAPAALRGVATPLKEMVLKVKALLYTSIFCIFHVAKKLF